MPRERAALLELAVSLGFQETAEAAAARADLIVAYRTAHRPAYLQALKQHALKAGIPDIMRDNRKYVGFLVAGAAMWLDAGDIVQYWRQIIFTQGHALNYDFAREVKAVLGPILDAATVDETRVPEFLQAAFAHEAAIFEYLERDDGPEPNLADGLKHCRIAECYLWLLEAALWAPSVDLRLAANLGGNVSEELLIAMRHLDGLPEQILAIRIGENLADLAAN
jgi:hypothetical protein